MNREEAEKLLRGGPEGIDEWNSRREQLEAIPNLQGVDLRGANLRGVNLSEAYLRGANLSEANLRGADLSGANLSETSLNEACLIKANLFHTDCFRADLHGADLRGADIDATGFTGANFRGVKLRPEQRNYLRNLDIHVGESFSRDVEAELTIEKDRAKELQVQLARLETQLAQQDIQGNNVDPKEHEKLKKRIAEGQKKFEESEVRGKMLAEENKRFKAEQEMTGGKIEKAIESLESPNKYISGEIRLHNCLFWGCLILALLCLVYLCYSFYENPIGECKKQEENKTSVDNNKTYQITGLELINIFAPRIFAASLFAVFLTQVNRRRRSVQELQERKRAIETLRGVFIAINTLSETPLLAKERIDKILNDLAKQALELGRDRSGRPTKADHESDHVEILKEIKELQNIWANKKA